MRVGKYNPARSSIQELHIITTSQKEREQFIDINGLDCDLAGYFTWNGYRGYKMGHAKDWRCTFVFRAEHKKELKGLLA